MGAFFRFVVGVLLMALAAASPAAAQESQAPEASAITATGVLERPEFTTYQYGEYAVTDEATGTLYALDSGTVDLGAYLGETVTVTGTVVPGYEEGAVEGGPALLEATAVEGAGSGGDSPAGAETATATFRLVVEGGIPEDFSFYVEDSQGTGGVICTTDRDVLAESNYPECRGGGATNEVEFPVGTGQPFDYRILGSRGVELSQNTVAEGSLTPTGPFVVDATYSFDEDPVLGAPTSEPSDDQYDPADPDSTTPDAPEEPDLNGDGAVDAADERYAARVSNQADKATDAEDDPVLPDTGGPPAALLPLVCALLAGGLMLRARR